MTKRVLPRSLLWFLPGLCLLAATSEFQLPILGLLSTLVLTVMFNAGFVFLGLEAWRGKISQLWLAAPAIWFGGYATLVMLTNLEIARINAQLRLANAEVRIPFDPVREDLVVVGAGNTYFSPET